MNLATAGNGDKGDQISLRVTASDGSLQSTPVTSAARTVANSAPSATVSLAPANPGTNVTLTATATRSDPDAGDTVLLSYVWKVNGVTVKSTPGSASPTDTLDLAQPGNGDPGQTVSVEVTPNDGTVSGTTATDQETVAAAPNQAPVVDSVVINQASPQTNDVLSATVQAHDPDGPTPQLLYQWLKGGSPIASATGRR